MATSLASQLQAIKSVVAGAPDPIKRPQTRPSVLFAPKEAADIDLRTILPIALSGMSYHPPQLEFFSRITVLIPNLGPLDGLLSQDWRFSSILMSASEAIKTPSLARSALISIEKRWFQKKTRSSTGRYIRFFDCFPDTCSSLRLLRRWNISSADTSVPFTFLPLDSRFNLYIEITVFWLLGMQGPCIQH